MNLTIVPMASLGPADFAELWEFARSYLDTTPEVFERGLRSKKQLGTARSGGRLVAMASIDVDSVTMDGEKHIRIFTGSVLIREDFRGRNIVQRLAVRTYLKVRISNPRTPCTGSLIRTATAATSCSRSTSGTSGRAVTAPCRRLSNASWMRLPASSTEMPGTLRAASSTARGTSA